MPRSGRLWLIVFSSLVFYGFWKPVYIILLLFAAVMDFYLAREIDKRENPDSRKALLIVSLVLNLGLLFYFKYLIFFRDNIEAALNLLGSDARLLPTLKIILPIGISFYTFETISYIVDVYRKYLKPESNFLNYLAFLVYFPHLIAGPVLRASDILPQLNIRIKFQWAFIIDGFQKIMIGLFLKVVIADNIAPMIDQGFAMSSEFLSAVDVWTLAFMFGFQIYFDFCAYSFIAIGAARMMGINFLENFNFPYMSTSPREFWKRWHISLSTWIRDYLYLPLTGRKVHLHKVQAISELQGNSFRSYSALFLTWAIMGFWHGANWTFIIWGLYHAILVTVHRFISRYTKFVNPRLLNVSGWMISLPLLMLGWIPFRASNLYTVKDYFLKVFDPSQYTWLGMRENIYLVSALLLIFIIMAYLIHKYIVPVVENTLLGQCANVVVMSFVVSMVIVFLRPINQFIYFQF